SCLGFSSNSPKGWSKNCKHTSPSSQHHSSPSKATSPSPNPSPSTPLRSSSYSWTHVMFSSLMTLPSSKAAARLLSQSVAFPLHFPVRRGSAPSLAPLSDPAPDVLLARLYALGFVFVGALCPVPFGPILGIGQQ